MAALNQRFPDVPHQPKTLRFPKCLFGKTRVVQVAFKPTWYSRWTWLNYDQSSDTAFWHICGKADEEGKLKVKMLHLYKGDSATGKMPPKVFAAMRQASAIKTQCRWWSYCPIIFLLKSRQNCVLEHQFSKFFLGEDPQTPPPCWFMNIN